LLILRLSSIAFIVFTCFDVVVVATYLFKRGMFALTLSSSYKSVGQCFWQIRSGLYCSCTGTINANKLIEMHLLRHEALDIRARIELKIQTWLLLQLEQLSFDLEDVFLTNASQFESKTDHIRTQKIAVGEKW